MPRKKYAPKSWGNVSTAPFDNAEEVWFWFVRCQRVRREGARFDGTLTAVGRPCDPDDVYLAAKELAHQHMIGTAHLKVLGRFGLLGRPPDPRCGEEDNEYKLWDEALDRLTTIFHLKGILR